MPREEKEEMKSIKIAEHTHSRLLILSMALGITISEAIDGLLEKAYPELIAETDKVFDSMASIRRITGDPSSRSPTKAR